MTTFPIGTIPTLITAASHTGWDSTIFFDDWANLVRSSHKFELALEGGSTVLSVHDQHHIISSSQPDASLSVGLQMLQAVVSARTAIDQANDELRAAWSISRGFC